MRCFRCLLKTRADLRSMWWEVHCNSHEIAWAPNWTYCNWAHWRWVDDLYLWLSGCSLLNQPQALDKKLTLAKLCENFSCQELNIVPLMLLLNFMPRFIRWCWYNHHSWVNRGERSQHEFLRTYSEREGLLSFQRRTMYALSQKLRRFV